MSKDTIVAILEANKRDLMNRYHVNELGLFGSYSRGEANINSDVDILVEFSEPISLFAFVELKNELSSLLGKNVDLVHKKMLKKIITPYVQKDLIFV